MSFINSVAKSMNGIKTIETSELIFTDDNSTLNTSAGITQAQTTGQTAINKSISAVGFNTQDGNLTLTTQGTGVNDLSVDLDGRYLTSIPSLDANDIPNLPASKITSGSFAVARIPALPYVSVGTAQAHTDETIFGVKTFNEFPKIELNPDNTTPDPTADNQFATKQYVDDNGGGGDAVLNGGTTQNPQTFTEFNKFDKNLILGDDLTMISTTETQNFSIEANANFSTTINQDAGFNTFNQKVKAGGTNRNVIEQDFFSNRTTGSINDFIQERSESNRIVQDGDTNSILQQNGDCVISQTGTNSTITTAGKMICATAPTSGDTTMLVNKTYVDGVASGSGSFRAFSVGDRRNPASARSVQGVSRFDPNVVIYQYPTTITMWDFTQNHHSITIAGYYSFYWGAAIFTSNTALTRLTIYKNGIYQNTTGGNSIASAGNQVTAVFHCDVGDKIQAGCIIGNMTYYAFVDTTYPSQRYNTFDGYLIQAT